MATPLRLESPVRVRFDECGADGLVRASALLRYAQDMAWAHSEAAGFDRAWYTAHGLTWLVRCLVLELSGTAASGATLGVSTEVTGWRRVWARRRSEVVAATDRSPVAADRTPIAVITTDWVLLGAGGSPVRIPAVIREAFPTPLPTFEPARVPLPATPVDAHLGAIEVRRHELDPLGHANHAVYADWLEDAVANAGGQDALAALPRTMRLEFIQSATLGTAVASAAWPTETGAWACRLTDGAGIELLRGEIVL